MFAADCGLPLPFKVGPAVRHYVDALRVSTKYAD